MTFLPILPGQKGAFATRPRRNRNSLSIFILHLTGVFAMIWVDENGSPTGSRL